MTSKKKAFSYLINKVQKAIAGWNDKLLSTGGKEVLLKAVAQAIPTYTMPVFLITPDLCSQIERKMNKCWWSHNNKGTGICWTKWDELCKSKQTGGLEFRHLQDFNKVMLAKQGWRLITRPTSLCARVLKHRYFRSTDFLHAGTKKNSSLTWQSIIEGRKVLQRGV